MDPRMRTNRDHWDELVGIHVKSRAPEGYDVEGFKQGRSALQSVEIEEVGDVKGKSLLHLQCHFGLDTLSWARLGARVTGVDFSERGIEQARALAAELGMTARFILSSLYDLPQVLEEEFDIVFTSYGVVNWLPDLRAWAQIIARFLRPGGFFYVIDAHPFARVFYAEPDATDLRVWLSYWGGTEPRRWEGDGSYADKGARLRNRVTFEWQHTLGEIVTSLTDAGLRIEFLHEFPFCAWEIFPFTVRGADGYYRIRDGGDLIPLLFSVRATKPR